MKHVYCCLREQWAALEVIREEAPDTFDRVTYRCHSRDATCTQRRCRLSEYGEREGAQDPWFDESRYA